MTTTHTENTDTRQHRAKLTTDLSRRARHASIDLGISLGDFITKAVEAAVDRHEADQRKATTA